MSKKISIRIDDSIAQVLADLAAEQNKTVYSCANDIMTSAVLGHDENRESIHEKIEELNEAVKQLSELFLQTIKLIRLTANMNSDLYIKAFGNDGYKKLDELQKEVGL